MNRSKPVEGMEQLEDRLLLSATVAAAAAAAAPPAKLPTSAYVVDPDGDGYGVGSSKGPDADPNDPTVNTADQGIAKYGSMQAFLQHLGYNPKRILYGPQDNIQPGDVIIYRAGTYTTTNYSVIGAINMNGTADAPITFMAMPGERVVLDGPAASIEIRNSSYINIDGFVLDNTSNKSIAEAGIFMHFANHINIRNVEAKNNQRGIYGGQDMHQILVEDSVIHDNFGSHGIYFGCQAYPNSDITVRNNIIYGNNWNGIQHNGRVTNLDIENNVFFDNGQTGISLIEGTSNSTIRNNLIFNNNQGGIVLYDYIDGNPSLGIVPYAEDNNLIENNIIWVGKSIYQDGSTGPGWHPGILFNDSTGQNISFTNNTIRGNIIYVYDGTPGAIEFDQSRIAAATNIVGNTIYRELGPGAILVSGGSTYDINGLNSYSSRNSGNVFANPGFKDVSISYYNDPSKFDFSGTSLTNVGIVGQGSNPNPTPTNADLTVGFGNSTLPTAITVGTTGASTVTVTNIGGQAAAGNVTLRLYATTNQTIDSNSVLLNTLSNQAVNLAPYAATDFTFNTTIPNMPAGNYQLIAQVDTTNSGITEASTTNNTVLGSTVRTMTAPVVPAPDLTAQISKMTFGANIAPGNAGTVSVSVANSGTVAAAGNVAVNLYISSDNKIDASDKLVAALTGQAVNLAPGGSQTLDMQVTVPQLPDGGYYYIAQVTPDSSISESNAANNTAVSAMMTLKNPVMPDLTVQFGSSTLPKPSFKAGDTGIVPIIVTNSGTGAAVGTMSAKLYATTSGVIDANSVVLATLDNQAVNLAAGASMNMSFNVTVPNMPAGDYKFIAQVDSGNAITETSKDNNTILSEVVRTFVPAVQQPDLTGAIASTTLGATWHAGDTGTVAVTIANGGTGAAVGTTTTKLYASASGAVDSSAILLGSQDQALNLAAGGSTTASFQVTLPTMPAGGYHLVAQVDAANTIAESNENNNLAVDATVRTFVVAPPPPAATADLTVQFGSSTLPKPSFKAGDKGIVPIIVTNSGTGAASGTMSAKLYATTSGVIDANSVVLATLDNQAVNLAAGASMNMTFNVTVPNMPAGNYKFIAQVDSGNTIAESNENNNTILSEVVRTFVPAALPNLTVQFGHSTLPMVMAAGNTGVVPFIVSNSGAGPAAGLMTVKLYAVTGTTLTSSAILLGTLSDQSISLAAGASANMAFNVTVPQMPAGSYRLIVQINATGSIAESNTGDNTAVSEMVRTVLASKPLSSLLMPVAAVNTTLLQTPNTVQLV